MTDRQENTIKAFIKLKKGDITESALAEYIDSMYFGMKGFVRVVIASFLNGNITEQDTAKYIEIEYRNRRSLLTVPKLKDNEK